MSTLIIKLLSTDAVIALIVGAFVTYIVKWLSTHNVSGKFEQYKGYAIAAIKAAEKAIPDDAENKSTRKLDFALRTFMGKYQAATGETPDEETVGKIESWLSVIHRALEETSGLGSLKGK